MAEENEKFLKQKATIEKKLSEMMSDQEEHDERSIASLYYDLGAVNDALEDYDEAI